MTYFIDSHCHFFNIDSIPLYSTITRLPSNFLVGLGGFTGPALPTILKKMTRSHRDFIEYFENDTERNIKRVIAEVTSSPLIPLDCPKVFTPLIMDFEKANSNERLLAQVRNLRNGISQNESFLAEHKARIHPFLGVDLRRLEENNKPIQEWFKSLQEECEIEIKSLNDRTALQNLGNGDFIGIKLYPSLGFEILPEHAPELHERQLAFFKYLSDQQIPVTVHCQQDSFKQGTEDDDKLIDFANPLHWQKVFGHDELKNLKINLAHFGGEDQVIDTLRFNSKADTEDLDGPSLTEYFFRRKSWTWNIMKILKSCPNAYSDISAYNFEKKNAPCFLAWLISIDQTGELDGELGPYRLADKLLWGSDYPMILNSTANYQTRYKDFHQTMNLSKACSKSFDKPEVNISQEQLVANLTNTNPVNFLTASHP